MHFYTSSRGTESFPAITASRVSRDLGALYLEQRRKKRRPRKVTHPCLAVGPLLSEAVRAPPSRARGENGSGDNDCSRTAFLLPGSSGNARITFERTRGVFVPIGRSGLPPLLCSSLHNRRGLGVMRIVSAAMLLRAHRANLTVGTPGFIFHPRHRGVDGKLRVFVFVPSNISQVLASLRDHF